MVAPSAIAASKSPLMPIDRKSTRLNSSHSQISYAVFCLKKKQEDVRQRRLERAEVAGRSELILHRGDVNLRGEGSVQCCVTAFRHQRPVLRYLHCRLVTA